MHKIIYPSISQMMLFTFQKINLVIKVQSLNHIQAGLLNLRENRSVQNGIQAIML